VRRKKISKKELSAIRKAKNGDEDATLYLWKKYRRMAFWVASKCRHIDGISLDDLKSAGFLGFMCGIKLFDESRRNSFSTFVFYTMQSNISREAHMPLIRLPHGKQSAVCSLRKKETHECDKTQSEIINDMQLSRKTKAFLEKYMHSDCFHVISFESRRPNGVLVAETIFNDVSAEDETDKAISHKQLAKALSVLKPKEYDIIHKYFGLGGEPPMNIVEIGAEMGVSKQRVGFIMKRGLKKMRRYLKAFEIV